jgi:hypothetical protein
LTLQIFYSVKSAALTAYILTIVCVSYFYHTVNWEKYRKNVDILHLNVLLLSVYVMPYVLGQITKLPISVYSIFFVSSSSYKIQLTSSQVEYQIEGLKTVSLTKNIKGLQEVMLYLLYICLQKHRKWCARKKEHSARKALNFLWILSNSFCDYMGHTANCNYFTSSTVL